MSKLWLVTVEERNLAAQLAHFHPEVAVAICTSTIPTGRGGSLTEIFCNSETTALAVYNQLPPRQALAVPVALYDTDTPEVIALSPWEEVRDTLQTKLSGWSYSDLTEDRDHLEALLATIPKVEG